jgi:hypothetical protein
MPGIAVPEETTKHHRLTSRSIYRAPGRGGRSTGRAINKGARDDKWIKAIGYDGNRTTMYRA